MGSAGQPFRHWRESEDALWWRRRLPARNLLRLRNHIP